MSYMTGFVENWQNHRENTVERRWETNTKKRQKKEGEGEFQKTNKNRDGEETTHKVHNKGVVKV